MSDNKTKRSRKRTPDQPPEPEAPVTEPQPTDSDPAPQEAACGLASEPTPDPAGEPPTPTEPVSETGETSVQQIVEAILFAADTALAPQKIVAVLGTGSAREIRKIVDGLNQQYAREQRPYRIEEIAGGLQMLTLPQYNTWVRRLRQSKQESRLSPAAMETLAVIAYKQPVVRAQVEAIRGVSVGEVLNRLRELGLVKIVGRDEDVGRPLLYGTTKRFLELFGLSSLEDLPAVEELQMPGGA